ncbi:YopX family protein [Fusobacterium animalis]|uniref:YopX family protein n=1 Tax=Fusobacterium animalis TaxID=76859 RepID=UPI0030D4F83D
MREIKFRCWDRFKQRWSNYKINDGTVYFMDKNTGVWYGSYNKRYKDFNLMQCSGLNDKNDREIYEGDILLDGNNKKPYKVIFKNGSFRAEFEGDFEEYSFDLIDVVAQGCEVVGNIYENPELMEDE